MPWGCLDFIGRKLRHRVTEKQIQGCTAREALGLGFEASSLTPEPVHPLSPGHSPIPSREMRQAGRG